MGRGDGDTCELGDGEPTVRGSVVGVFLQRENLQRDAMMSEGEGGGKDHAKFCRWAFELRKNPHPAPAFL